MPEYYIWWQNQSDSETLCGGEDDYYDVPPEWWDLPEWLWHQCYSRYGRPGRGRLWVPNHINLQEISWNESKTPQVTWTSKAGGIVFDAEYLPKVLGLPGFITDLELNLIRGQDVK